MVKLILLVVVALGTAWLSLSTYLPRALPDRFEAANNVYRVAIGELVATNNKISDETYRQLADAARQRPLDSEPLFFFGMRALSSEDGAAGERLLRESRQRNPRYLWARLGLMSLFFGTRRVGEGSAELSTLVRVLPRAAEILVPELARLAADPRSRASVEQAIGDQPIMANVLNALVQRGADPQMLLALAARQPRPTDGSFAPWQSNLVARLADGGDVRGAYELWRRFVGVESAGLVYDPDFRGAPGPPPFNWELTGSALGAAERMRGGGLEIDYYGRQAGPLARQLLLLRPGRYRLDLQAEGSATGPGSRIVLKVACRGREDDLLAIRFENLAAASRRLGADFTVPAGCDTQWIGFYGEAVEFPTTQRARITGLSLRPAGG